MKNLRIPIFGKSPKNKQALQRALTAFNKTKQSNANKNPPQEAINQLANLYYNGRLTAKNKLKPLQSNIYQPFMTWNILVANKGLQSSTLGL